MSNKGRLAGVIILFMGIVLIAGGLFAIYNNRIVLPNNQNSDEVKKQELKDSFEKLNMISRAVFTVEKKQLNVTELTGERLIHILMVLSQKELDKVTGNELKKVAHDNFGIDNIKFVDVNCGMEHEGTTIKYRFNTETDKYEYNPAHINHDDYIDSIFYFFSDEQSDIEGDYYIFNAGVFYYDEGCVGDSCGEQPSLNVYLTYDDAVNKKNLVMNAFENSEYCNESASIGFSCNANKIYKGLKNPKRAVFYYKKVNNDFVFDNYVIK